MERCVCVSHSVMSDSLRPHGLQLPLSMEVSRTRIMEWIAISFSRGSSFKPGSPTLQADSLPSEPPGKVLTECQNGMKGVNR